MVASLIFRNSRRSMKDHLLYCVTITILMMIMHVANLLNHTLELEVAVQGQALSMLIVLILFVLLATINSYMIKSRSKEFSLYILLGMNANFISLVFFIELLIIAAICLFVGMVVSSVLFSSIYSILLQAGELNTYVYTQASVDTSFWFLVLESIILFYTCYVFHHKSIHEMLKVDCENEQLHLHTQVRWWCALTLSSLLFLLCLSSTIRGSDTIIQASMSLISIPVVVMIYAFYHVCFGQLMILRERHDVKLYQNDRLYISSLLLSKGRTNIRLYFILSFCLLCSFISFFLASFLIQYPKLILSGNQQAWMVFIQYAISLIFIVLFFSVLSIYHVIDVKKYQRGCVVHHRLGMSQNSIAKMLRKEIHVSFLFPSVGTFVIVFIGLLLITVPLQDLPSLYSMMSFICIAYIGCFMLCFILYGCVCHKTMLMKNYK